MRRYRLIIIMPLFRNSTLTNVTVRNDRIADLDFKMSGFKVPHAYVFEKWTRYNQGNFVL